MALPKDPFILLSMVNTKLRDFYPNLDTLCDREDAGEQELKDSLNKVGYHYDEKVNQFVRG